MLVIRSQTPGIRSGHKEKKGRSNSNSALHGQHDTDPTPPPSAGGHPLTVAIYPSIGGIVIRQALSVSQGERKMLYEYLFIDSYAS